MKWHDDLCEYYNVSPEEADLLGTRKKGRKPSLPGSETCAPVSGLTFEEIWDSKARDTSEQIFDFYKEIGKNKEPGSTVNILEYGAGVAPICIWLADNFKNLNFNFYINDVPSEHLTFGEWRLKKRNQNVKKFEIAPEIFPNYGDVKFDLIYMLDVLEHMDKPFSAVEALLEYCKPNETVLLETWVEHNEQALGTGCDLDREKKETVKLIKKNFSLVQTGVLRCWRKLMFF